MKVFDSDNTSWYSKVNFIDENNVFVGYDMSACCCEDFGWFISPSVEKDIIREHGHDYDLGDYVFDVDFFQEEVDFVVFRLIDKNNRELFLHLFNIHEGYYSHGFEMKEDNVVLHEGYI